MKHYRYDAKPVLISRASEGDVYRQKFSSAPLRYLDGRKWRDIDTRCSSVGKNYLNMVLAPYRAYIPKYADGIVAFENMSHAIMMKPLCDHVHGQILEDNVVGYKNAFAQGVHLRYSAGRSCFRKEIVITKKPLGTSDIVFDFIIDFENIANLGNYDLDDLTLNDNLDLQQDNDYRSVIRRPCAWDAALNEIKLPIRIRTVNGRYRLRKIIPRSFLDSAVYPIVTDASTYYGIPSNLDGNVTSEDATWSTCRSATSGDSATDSGTVLTIQASYTGSIYRVIRCLLAWNISSLDDNASISSGNVHVRSTFAGDCWARVVDPRGYSDSDIGPPDSLTVEDFEWLRGDALESATDMADAVDLTSSGWKITPLSANGISAIDLTDDYYRLAFRDHARDYLNSTPGSVYYSYVASANAASNNPILELTYTMPIVHEGTGGGEVSGGAIIGASFPYTCQGGAKLGNVGGIVISGAEVTSNGFFIVSKLAKISGVTLTSGSENSNFPISNITTIKRPFKVFRTSSTGVYVFMLYFDNAADTVIFYNVTAPNILATVVEGTDYTLTVNQEMELGIWNAVFRYSGWFTKLKVTFNAGTAKDGASHYKLGGVLAGMRTELSVRPKQPLNKKIRVPVSEKRYSTNNLESENLGHPRIAMRYAFPAMTPTQFQQIEEIEREMTAQGLCGIIEQRVASGTRDHAYIAYRTSTLKFSHTENDNIISSIDFEGIS